MQKALESTKFIIFRQDRGASRRSAPPQEVRAGSTTGTLQAKVFFKNAYSYVVKKLIWKLFSIAKSACRGSMKCKYIKIFRGDAPGLPPQLTQRRYAPPRSRPAVRTYRLASLAPPPRALES